MNRFTILSLFVSCFFGVSLVAAEENKKMAVTVDPGSAIIGYFSGGFQYKLSESASLSAQAAWYDSRSLPTRVYSLGYGPYLGLGARVHLNGSPLATGFYVEPMVKLGFIVHPSDTINPNGNFMTRMGATLGYSHVFDFGLLIEAGAGLERYYVFGKLGDPQVVGGRRSFVRPVAQASIGYAW